MLASVLLGNRVDVVPPVTESLTDVDLSGPLIIVPALALVRSSPPIHRRFAYCGLGSFQVTEGEDLGCGRPIPVAAYTLRCVEELQPELALLHRSG